MKLLYIWIEEFRNIKEQGIVIDEEYIVTVKSAQKSHNNCMNAQSMVSIGDGWRNCQIEIVKNNSYKQKQNNSPIVSIAALFGENASGKTSIMECLYEKDSRHKKHYFLVFLNENTLCIEIYSNNIKLYGNVKEKECNEIFRYKRYIMHLEGYKENEYEKQQINPPCILNCASRKNATVRCGYTALEMSIITNDLDKLNEKNSFAGVFEFLCSFNDLGGENNHVALFLRDDEELSESSYFSKSYLNSEEYKYFFVNKLAQILFSRLQNYLYNKEPEYMANGGKMVHEYDENLKLENHICMKLLSKFNISFPKENSESLSQTLYDENLDYTKNTIKEVLTFFKKSTFIYNGKSWYDNYILNLSILFDCLFSLPDEMFKALYKVEIPFDMKYKNIIYSIDSCINSDALKGNWTSNLNIRFEWLSAGELYLSMLFSTLYESMKWQSNNLKNRNVILLIDEPEIHMHPITSRTFISTLDKVLKGFKEKYFLNSFQIILATHSPFIVQSLNGYNSTFSLINKSNDTICVERLDNTLRLRLPKHDEYSFNMIMYVVFGIPTIELHNELYGELQFVTQNPHIDDMDKWFAKEGVGKNRKWLMANGRHGVKYVTLHTFIRNSIHHPDNHLNSHYTEDELKDSIDKMILLLWQQEDQ